MAGLYQELCGQGSPRLGSHWCSWCFRHPTVWKGQTWELNPPDLVSPPQAVGSARPGFVKPAGASGSGRAAPPKPGLEQGTAPKWELLLPEMMFLQ